MATNSKNTLLAYLTRFKLNIRCITKEILPWLAMHCFKNWPTDDLWDNVVDGMIVSRARFLLSFDTFRPGHNDYITLRVTYMKQIFIQGIIHQKSTQLQSLELPYKMF